MNVLFRILRFEEQKLGDHEVGRFLRANGYRYYHLGGWSEQQVVTRFWVLGAAFAIRMAMELGLALERFVLAVLLGAMGAVMVLLVLVLVLRKGGSLLDRFFPHYLEHILWDLPCNLLVDKR